MPSNVQTSDADLIAYQSELVRTGKFTPAGKMSKIAIGPSANWQEPKDADPYLKKYGRFIDLRGNFLPIGFADPKIILITAPLLVRRDGAWQVGLPDVPVPEWRAPDWTEAEVTGLVKRDPEKNRAATVAQRLTDRCEMVNGQPAVLEGTDFLIFQPVEKATFQPEINEQLAEEMWIINFYPLGPVHPAFLVNHKTGECHFFGGTFDIERPRGA